MFKEYRPFWAEINLDNFIHNVNEIKTSFENKNIEYIAVVKADAYGHGAVEIAKICKEMGIKWFAVAMLDEALELRKAGIDDNILILGYTPPNMAEIIVDNNINQTCYSFELADALSKAATSMNKIARIHIALDTGMGRIGFSPSSESADIIQDISKLPNLKIEGLFTHFAVADEKDKTFTHMQFSKYEEFLKMLYERNVSCGMLHVGNSAEIIDLKELNLDAVRPGIIQYGLYPSSEVAISRFSLKPVMSLKANIIHVKEVKAGTSISYGRKFITNRTSKIATIPVGYADGYSRLLFGKAKVIINGKLAPIVGNICMDQCMVDITDVGTVSVGDEVVLMGEDSAQTPNISISAEDIATMLGTINYEVVCMLSRRVPRVYIRGGKVVKVKNYLA